MLLQLGDTVTINTEVTSVDAYSAAVDLAARYRLDIWTIYGELKRIYDTADLPLPHLEELSRQIESQTCFYEIKEEKVDVALALVKPDGFTKETDPSGAEFYTAEIMYPRDREHLLLSWQSLKPQNPRDFSFHYTPYNFDSKPEKSFIEQIISYLNLKPNEVEDIYFTGAITDPARTDFFVDYKDDKGKWRRYTPDFIIRRKPKKGSKQGTGKVFIVEIKREHDRAHPIDGEQGKKALALRKWEQLNPDRLKYEMIFTAADTVSVDQLKEVREFVEESDT